MKIVYPFLFLLSVFTFSQESKVLNAKLSADDGFVENVTVMNTTKRINATTNKYGYFKIKANVNDEIVISSIHLKTKKIIITQKQLDDELFIIKMELNQKFIKEIFITNNDQITAESLGLVPKGLKILTPAERRYKQATGLIELNQGINLNVDALINQISGRSKQLKKDLNVERKEIIQDKILLNYDKDFFINQYKIPEQYVEGFLFYIVEDKDFIDAYKAKNKVLMQFIMSKLAVDYLNLKNNVSLEKAAKKNDTIPLDKN